MTARAWWNRLARLALLLTSGCLYQTTTGTLTPEAGKSAVLASAEPPTLPPAPRAERTVSRGASIIEPPAEPVSVVVQPAPESKAKPKEPTVTPPAPPPDAPLVAALRQVMEDHPDKAARALDGIDRPCRERLLALLKLTAGVQRKALEKMTAAEIDATLDHLRELHEQLRPQASLKLQGVCFCRGIHGFGQYEPVPAGTAFQAGVDGQAGERLQVYAEVRNFSSKAVGGGQHETKLESVLEVHDAQKRCVKKMSLGACTDRSQTPRHDYFLNFQFHVPAKLEPGEYKLVVVVRDATHDGPPREARSVVGLRICPGGSPER